MKNILAGLLLTASFAIASAQTISFNETTHNYGTLAKGADGTTFFNVTNTGDKPLIISNVHPACGCTTPEWSKDPIMPGKSAKIKVGYNTSNPAPFEKLIEVYSNDPKNARSVLYIKGTVTDAAATSGVVANGGTQIATMKNVQMVAVKDKNADKKNKKAKK